MTEKNQTKGSIDVTYADGSTHTFTSIATSVVPDNVITTDDVDSSLSTDSMNPVQNKTLAETIDNKADLVNGIVPSSQLPSYVDDVVEYSSISEFPEEGEQGKIYLAIDTSLCYRWSGTQYVQIAGSTSVLMFASQANFPAEGEEGVIYVAEDTNKQYRWDESAYVELSKEEFEIVTYSSGPTITLTDDQLRKAINGSLFIKYNNKMLSKHSDSGSNIYFYTVTSFSESSTNSYVPLSTEGFQYVITLDKTTKVLSAWDNQRIFRDVSATYQNFFDTSVDPVTSGKRLVREMNIRKTQDMIADVYDATATYAVGDVVIYQNDLYECNTAIETAEAWNASHWDRTSVAAVVLELQTEDVHLQTEINTKQETLISGENIKTVNGQSILGAGNIIEAASELEVRRLFRAVYDITADITNGEYVGPDTIYESETQTVEIHPDNLHDAPESVTVTGASFVYSIDNNIGTIVLSSPVDDVAITAICPVHITVDPVFGNNSWEVLAQVIDAGKFKTYWPDYAVNACIKEDVGVDGYTRRIRVVDAEGMYGKNVVLELLDLEPTLYQFDPTTPSGYTVNYSTSYMRLTVLPEVYNKFSASLRDFITDTTYKVAETGYTTNIIELTDKIFLPAERELLAEKRYSNSNEWSALRRFAYYSQHGSSSDRLKHRINQSTNINWFERSPSNYAQNYICNIGQDGVGYAGTVQNNYGVSAVFAR